jgi:hypothetical protein
MKRITLILSIWTLAGLAQAANYPFGMNVNYAYGFRPASAATGSWANDNTTLQGKYNSWKSVHVVSAGAGMYRVQRDSANSYDTVSEGISYGMLLAVYFNDQATFDGLWAYKQSKNDGLGLMNWDISSGGGVIGGNSATDADEDIAYSLYLASAQWGNGGANNYKSLGDAEVLKLKSYDLDGSFHVKPGDSFDSCRYPSYFFPNEYRVFGEQTNDTYTWNNVMNNVYATIAAARNGSTGLLAEQCTDTGQGGGCGVSSSQYQYNSCRVPLRMALDYVYYGNASSGAELALLDAYWPTVAPGGAGSIYDCQNISGGQCGSFNNSAFTGPAATGYMHGGGANLQSYYDFVMGANETANYYAGAIQLLSLLLMSGNMQNIADPAAIYSPTPTPSPTPYAGSPTPTFTQTPMTFGYVYEDFELGSMSSFYNYAGTGSSVTAQVTNSVVHAGTYADKVTVNVAASSWAGFGFNSNYLNAQGILNMSGTNVVRFWINTPNTISMNISFKEGNGVGGGDNEQWKSPIITVFGMAGWQLVTTPQLSTWTVDTTCSPSCNAAGDKIFELSSIRTCQISFNAPLAATTLYIDDIDFVPAVAPTPTFTKTPFNNPYNQIFDDFESPMSLSVSAGRAGTYADAANGASASWSLDTVTVADGAKSGKLTFNTGTAASYGCGGFLISPYGTPQLYTDASGAVSLAMWMYSTTPNLKYQVEFTEAGSTVSPTAGADGEAWLSPLQTYSGPGWQWMVVDLATFSEDIYNAACTPNCLTTGNNHMDLQAISSVTIKINPNQGSGSVNIDDVNFITTFKTSTPSQTPSFTVTYTPSASGTKTPSASPSPTSTATASPSPSASPTATASASPSRTSSYTSTYTGSPTGTPTASPSPSNTPNYSPTPTPTFTNYAGSPTDSPTVSPTPSSSRTNTLLPSATSTLIPTLTNTPVATPTQTSTPVPTSTFTAISTAALTFTPSQTPPPDSVTDTPTYSPVVPTATFTATLTNSPVVPTATLSATFTHSPVVPTATFTATLTNSPVVPTATFTATLTNSPVVPTATNTPLGGHPGTTPTQQPGSNVTPTGSGPILKVLSVPNPGVPDSIYVQLDAAVDNIDIKIFTRAMLEAYKVEAGPAGGGWFRVRLPEDFISHASSGDYFYVVEATRNGAVSMKNGIGNLYILK